MTPLGLMAALTAGVYLAFKAWTWRPLPAVRAAAYLLLWPGMDPEPFRRRQTSPSTDEAVDGGGPPAEWREGPPALLAGGILRALAGVALLSLPSGRPVLDALGRLAGTGLLVHFGLCDVLAAAWRRRGVAVERLFDRPSVSRTLAEFWGRRWNLAFSAVARERVFRPLARRWGTAAASLGTFAFSGLVHELLLSVPAGGGYGGPTAYFLLQGTMSALERRWAVVSRLWTLGWVLIPSPLLFHPPFVRTVLLAE